LMIGNDRAVSHGVKPIALALRLISLRMHKPDPVSQRNIRSAPKTGCVPLRRETTLPARTSG
jgi:hypothetical protein